MAGTAVPWYHKDFSLADVKKLINSYYLLRRLTSAHFKSWYSVMVTILPIVWRSLFNPLRKPACT